VKNNNFFRELKSFLYNEIPLTEEFKQFVQNVIWPMLNELHTGYRLDEKKELTAQIICNLVKTGLTGNVVADNRNNNDKQARKRITIWDALVKNGFCKVCKGSQISQNVTRYRATGNLLNLQKKWDLNALEDLNLKRNTQLEQPTSHALVVLKDKNKKPQSIRKFIELNCQRDDNDYRKPDQRALQNGLNHFKYIENLLNQINTINLSHSWISYATNPETGNRIVFQPNVCLRQIYSEQLFQGGRLYSWGALDGQSMSKEQRQTIKIDGKSVAEIDSQCHNIRLVYHLSNIDERGDVYWPEKIFSNYYSFKNINPDKLKIVRDFVKKCTNIVLNNSTRKTAVQAICGELNNDENKHREFLKTLIFKTENTDVNGIIDRLIQVHPKKVSDKFFINYGMELMRIDGLIMLYTLNELVVERKKPALAIHDSLVVKQTDLKKAQRIFSENYRKFMLYKPVINRKY